MTSSAALILVPLLLTASPEEKEAAAFERFLEGVRKDARKQGISEETLKVLDGLAPIPRVIELQNRQPERTMTFERFLEIILTEERIAEGRRRLAAHRTQLEAASKKYGVPPEIIVALWGIETKYGAVMGDYSVVGSLATLASRGRRQKFFRSELLHALKILDEGHITPERMKGSWAGAMGQCQFMPSTFVRHAADGDGDGKRDIWTNVDDVFASAANYLSKIGYDGRAGWGREVTVPEKIDPAVLGLKGKARPLSYWKKLGVALADRSALPDGETQQAWLIRPDGDKGRAVLAFPNFKRIMEWNRSQYFAAAVGMLADRIAAPPASPGSATGEPAAR